MKSIYLDYAATTPVDPEVAKKIESISQKEGDYFGNPNSLHYYGQKARSIVDFSRQEIAKSITANFRDILFTSSATEANNLILRGVLKSFFKKNKGCGKIPKIIISSTEHPSILETARILEGDGAVEVAYLPVDSFGIIDLEFLKKALNERTILISVMWANNETGVIQPISEIVRIANNFRNRVENCQRAYPLVHTDAVQAFSVMDLNVIKSGVDFMTLSSHKIYGPKGAGAVYIKGGADAADFIEPIITGGGQEYGLRSGTENVEAIAGFAYAAKKTFELHKKEFDRLIGLSERLFERIKKEIPDVEINGPTGFKRSGTFQNRVPHIINLYFPGIQDLGVKFDIAGVAVSSGSACSQRYEQPSHVLGAMGFSPERIRGSVRFSFGRFTAAEEIDEAAKRIIISIK